MHRRFDGIEVSEAFLAAGRDGMVGYKLGRLERIAFCRAAALCGRKTEDACHRGRRSVEDAHRNAIPQMRNVAPFTAGHRRQPALK